MNLLITGAWGQAADYICEIEQQGHTVSFLQYEKDKLPCDYAWVEGVICNGLFLTHPIEKFTNLKYIQLTSAGYDRVPMDYIEAHGIVINNARGVYSIPMAEFALCGVLQLYKQTRFFEKNRKAHLWEKHRGLLELHEKNVCIAGCGSVGTECAKRFRAFGCHISGVDISVREDDNYDEMLDMSQLENVLAKSDVVVLALPLTEKTKHLMNKRMFEKMKDGAVLVNVSRGAMVEEEALCEALESKLGGAVLDVFEEEPLAAESPLWEMEHVIVTPHNSFVGDGNGARLADVIMRGLQTIG